MIEVSVETQYSAEMIKQRTELTGHGLDPNLNQGFTERVINLQDQGIIDALKTIGWGDPLEVAALKREIKRLGGVCD